MNRRGLLRSLAALPAALSVVSQRVGVDLGGPIPTARGMPAEAPPPTYNGRWQEVIRSSLVARAEYESLLYERFRTIGYIDPDLAVYRSFSLAAKICFQRQREVQRALAEADEADVWSRIHRFMNSLR